MRSSARHLLRRIGQRYPALRHFSGRLGLGRLVAPSHTRERITIDNDIIVEFDLGVPIFKYLYFHHDFNASPEFRVMRTLLKLDMTCVDVGAHIGYFSLVAAKYSGQVIAFEPNPGVTKLFERNLELNSHLATRIRFMKCALSSRPGIMRLYTSISQPDLASLAPIDMPDVVIQDVRLQTMDESIPVSHSNIGFLKIDVEGAELDVLKGGVQLIEKHQPIIMLELIEKHQQRFARSCETVVDFLISRGYQAYHITESDPVLKAFARNSSFFSASEGNNALFVPARRAGDVSGLR